MSLVLALITAAAAGSAVVEGVGEDRTTTLAEVAAATAVCLDVMERPEREQALLADAGWRALPGAKAVINGQAIPLRTGLYWHATNAAVLTPGQGVYPFCGVQGYLAARLAPEALATFVEGELGGRPVAALRSGRGVWTVRGLGVQAWVSREAQSPAVTLLVGRSAMEKK